MTEDNRLAKVELLIKQQKYSEAEKILGELLTNDSTNISYIALLSEVCLHQDKLEDAKSLINQAIGSAPDSPDLFYIKSRVSLAENDLKEAEKNIKQSIELDPEDADYHALLANIKLSRKDYEGSLEQANRALEIEPENLLGLNTRSRALLKLNQSEESFETIENALHEDPNNAYTHANYGWGLLEKGNHKKALVHFQESLKIEPDFDYAQAGMMEAIKASNPIYRLFLNYSFWIGNLTGKYQWGVLIGFYVFSRALNSLAKENEALQPFLYPILILLAAMAFCTWIITPISNLFLRFNKYGKILLSENEKTSSNFVGISAVISLLGLILYFTQSDERYLSLLIFGLFMMLPLSLMYTPSKFKNAFLYFAMAMTGIGALAIGQVFTTGDLFNSISIVFLISIIGFQWVSNYFAIQEDNL